MRLSFMLAAFCAGIAAQTSAATLFATAVNSDQSIGSFTIDFSDANANRLLEFSEVTTFSGAVTLGIRAGDPPVTRLVKIPTIDGISLAGGVVSGSTDSWTFADRDGTFSTFLTRDAWTYEITGLDAPAVPLPASVLLFLIALGSFGALRLRDYG